MSRFAVLSLSFLAENEESLRLQYIAIKLQFKYVNSGSEKMRQAMFHHLRPFSEYMSSCSDVIKTSVDFVVRPPCQYSALVLKRCKRKVPSDVSSNTIVLN